MNEGFFGVVASPSKRKKENNSPTGCLACELYKTCETPKMSISGKGKKKILVVGEAPGKQEDEQGTQFVGSAGQRLRRTFKQVGVDLEKDCWKTNAVNCRPPNNKTPTSKQIQYCRPRLFKAIEDLKPNVIIPLGNIPINSLLKNKLSSSPGGITKWRGWQIPDREYNAWICPAYHPSFVMRKQEKVIDLIFKNDLQKAKEISDKKLPPEVKTNEIKILRYDEDVIPQLKEIIKTKSKMAFDYETTGIKPFREGHRIISCAISTSKNTIAFLLTEKNIPLLRTILQDKQIKKIGANIKFESIWSQEYLKCKVNGWVHDTMLTAHLLDNRRGITSLKFQAYVNFGIEDYSSGMHSYMKSIDSHGANSFNSISSAPVKDLLFYNGVDALVTRLLSKKQIVQVRT